MIKSKEPMLGSFREKINTSLLNFFKHGFVFLAVNTEIKAMVDKVFKKNKPPPNTHTQEPSEKRNHSRPGFTETRSPYQSVVQAPRL